MKEKLLSIKQAAEQLSCSVRSCYRLVSDCEIQGLKIRGSLKVTESSIQLHISRMIQAFQIDNGVPE